MMTGRSQRNFIGGDEPSGRTEVVSLCSISRTAVAFVAVAVHRVLAVVRGKRPLPVPTGKFWATIAFEVRAGDFRSCLHEVG
jgi:hypothetical protein